MTEPPLSSPDSCSHLTPESGEDASTVPLSPKKLSSSFHYDPDIFAQCQKYLSQKNYHGLALIARQRGIPPFLRFKVWPILFKHHPFVLNPFIQPDNDLSEQENTTDSSDSEDSDSSLSRKIRKDLRKYLHRITSPSDEPLQENESVLFDTLEKSIHKFVSKWGKIINYHSSLAWIALGLAEWFPPIPHTPWVLLGRDVTSSNNTHIGSVFDNYQEYISTVPGLDQYLDELVQDDTISSMSFHEVYERLVLILLHSPESANKRHDFKIDKSTLPINGGTIEERVSFFIYVLQILLPELSRYFEEEQILNKFGSRDDEWAIWWLKFCGAKVWSRVDRGRVWDLLAGWRYPSKKIEHNRNYYIEKLNISDELLDKLGPDVFWTVDYDEFDDNSSALDKKGSFTNLMSELHISSKTPSDSSHSIHQHSHNSHNKDGMANSSSSTSRSTSPVLSSSSDASSTSSCDIHNDIPFSKIDLHIELLFISVALLQAKENTLVELDQHEIRTFLSRLPAKTFKASDKYKQYQEQKDKEKGAVPVEHGLRYDYMDSIIFEAGELWRKWLYREQT